MSLKIFEIVEQANAIEQAIMEAGGELTPEKEAALASVDLAMAEKVDGYFHVIGRLDVTSDYWKAKADQYAKIAKSTANVAKRLNDAIKQAMLAMNKTEVVGNDVRFKLSKTKAALIIDETKLNPSYLMQVTETVPDKKRIEEELKMGIPVDGACFRESFGLRAYLTKKEC